MSNYTDASLVFYPSGYKESKAYSLKPTDGSGDLTFTRASTATRVNAEGLIEGVRTNLLTYSEQFDNAAWVKVTNPTITANATTSPDGTTNADKLIPSTSVGRQAVSQNNSSTGAVSMSVYAKKGEYDIVQLTDSRNPTAFANFDLTNGVLGSVSDFTATIASVGSGWYRCSISYDYTLSLSAFRISVQQLATDVRLPEWAGNGTDGIYIYGAQLEQSPSVTEYIPTTTTAVSVGMLANVPRIDYTGGGCGKLLLEPQRTNLVLRSEEFDNSYWTKTNATITANSTTSPDGTTNADKLVENTTNSSHSVRTDFIVATSGSTYTYSVFAKKGERDFILVFDSYINSGYWFDLNNGTIGSKYGAASVTSKIENYGSGWYRCSITFAASGSGYALMFNNAANADNVVSYLGDGTSGVYIWGAQLEAGSYSTSLINTTTTAVTRVADGLSVSSLFSKGIVGVNGSLFVDINTLNLSGLTFTMWNTLSQRSGVIRFTSASNTFYIGLLEGGSGSTQISLGSLPPRAKLLFRKNGTTYTLFYNGVKASTDMTAPSQTWDKLEVESGFSPNMTVNSVILFNSALSDTDAIALTTI